MKSLYIILLLSIAIISCTNTVEHTEQNSPPAAPAYTPHSNAKFTINSKNDYMVGANKFLHLAILVENYNESDSVWLDIIHDGDNRIKYDYKFIAIFYFNDPKHIFDVSHGLGKFGDTHEYDKSCVAACWLFATGKVEYKKYPMKD